MYTKNQLQVELKVPAPPPVSKEKTHVHKTLISGLSRKMSRRRAGEECLSGRRMPPLCLLLLLLPLSGATAALSLEGGLTGHYSHGGVSSPCLGRTRAPFLAVLLPGLLGYACGLPAPTRRSVQARLQGCTSWCCPGAVRRTQTASHA